MAQPLSRSITGVEWILAVAALGIATFLIFQNLAAPAIRQWDEAIYADNALDMYMTGDPIVMRRNGEVTFYNTKPPLVIWLQTLSLHAFGINEFAIRFPSALAGVLTCVAMLLFSILTLKKIRIGIVAILILGTTYG
jgi:4-amino-4-deoxy-L-arabinose transferase-like glycosyltransferase